MLEIYYLINENDEFECIFYDETIELGNKVSFLFDKETGMMLNHGKPKLVKEFMRKMMRTLSQASVEMPEDIPEEIRKEVCNMKEALVIEEFSVGEIDADTLTRFVNCSNYYKFWKERQVFNGKKR